MLDCTTVKADADAAKMESSARIRCVIIVNLLPVSLLYADLWHRYPWFNKHTDTSKKQTALQESESTNYVIGVMSEILDYDALPAI